MPAGFCSGIDRRSRLIEVLPEAEVERVLGMETQGRPGPAWRQKPTFPGGARLPSKRNDARMTGEKLGN